MRFISVAAVCALAASSNVFAVPLGQEAEGYISRRTSSSSLSSTAGDSEALSLGKVATGLSIASGIVPFFQGIFGGGSSPSRRDLEELESVLKREGLGSLLTRQSLAPERLDSFRLCTLGGDICTPFGGISTEISNKGSGVVARATGEGTADDSEALSLGKVATGLSVASGVLPLLEGAFHSIFGGNSTASRRDLEELERLLKREDLGPLLLSRSNSTADQSGSLNFLSIGEDIISALSGLFGGGSSSSNQQRDLVMHVARKGAAPKVSTATSESSSGSTLENVANGFSIASAVSSIFHDFFGGSGNSTKRDELMAVLQARNVTTATSADGSGALDLGSILQTILGLLPIKRELADAADSESGALKLPNLEQIANGFSIANSGVNILHTLFGGSSDSTQRREIIEQLLRRGADSPDASGAIALGSLFKTLGNIGSIALNGGSILGDLFGGSSSNSTQARELVELLARHAEARRETLLSA